MAQILPLSSFDLTNPFEAMQKLKQDQIDLDIKQTALENARKQMEQQAAQQTDLSNLSRLVQSGQVRPEDYVSLMAKYPALAESIGKGQEAYTSKQKEAEAKFGLGVVMALENKNIDVAKSLLQERVDALRNSGQEAEAAKIEAVGKMIDINPDIAKMAGNMALVSGVGAQKYLELKAKSGTGGSDLPASIKEAIGYMQMTDEQRQIFDRLQQAKTPSSTINVSTGNASSKAVGELIPGWYEKAASAQAIRPDIARMREALNKDAITGKFAETRIDFARLANTLGFTGGKALESTQTLIKGMAELALQARDMLKGTGQITEYEQKLCERARSGDISLTDKEIGVVLDVAERASQLQYTRNVKLLEKNAVSGDVNAQNFVDILREEYGTTPPTTPLPVPAGATPPAMPASAGLPPPPLGKPLYKVDY
jgi:hypothetical protein